MAEAGEGVGLVSKPAQRVVGDGVGADHLERDPPRGLGLPGLVDGAHPAAPEQPDDRVAADALRNRVDVGAPLGQGVIFPAGFAEESAALRPGHVGSALIDRLDETVAVA